MVEHIVLGILGLASIIGKGHTERLMDDILNWVGRNPNQAFGLGFFLLLMGMILLGLAERLFNFLVKVTRAFTGKYPPPEPARPIVQCDGNCKRRECCRCCEEGCSDDHCDCQNV